MTGIEFQSTLPQGERHTNAITRAKDLIFQSTLPQGERLVIKLTLVTLQLFQSTLPQGERLYLRSLLYIVIIFQSTLPQGERHHFRRERWNSSVISIHAPARGATYADSRIPEYYIYFNPRSRKGSDGFVIFLVVHNVISIHAPARGATCHCVTAPQPEQFQSTLPQGERREGATQPLISSADFNPRSRKGSDIF